MKIMLKWMRGRNLLKLFCNQVGSNKKFLHCSLPEEPRTEQLESLPEPVLQTKKKLKAKRKKKTKKWFIMVLLHAINFAAIQRSCRNSSLTFWVNASIVFFSAPLPYLGIYFAGSFFLFLIRIFWTQPWWVLIGSDGLKDVKACLPG